MPMKASIVPLGDERSSVDNSTKDQLSIAAQQAKDDSDSGFGVFEEFSSSEDLGRNSDMEGSIHRRSRRRMAKNMPDLPQRSDKRMSRMVASGTLELRDDNDCKTPRVVEQHVIVSDPHELYLSSEEEGSIIDDYEGSLFDFDDAENGPLEKVNQGTLHSRTSSRGSQAESARAVSFIVVGKPQIINIHVTAPAHKPRSLCFDLKAITHESFSRPRPATTQSVNSAQLTDTSCRRMSIASISSNSTHNLSTPSQQFQSSSFHPRRIASNFGSLITSTKNSLNNKTSDHSFLDSDPFAAKEVDEHQHGREQGNVENRPVTPKTPSGASAAAAWRRGMNRTMNITKKPSIPSLNLAAQRNSLESDLGQGTVEPPAAQQQQAGNGKPYPMRESGAPTEPISFAKTENHVVDLRKKMGTVLQPSPFSKGKRTANISLAMIGFGRRKVGAGRDPFAIHVLT